MFFVVTKSFIIIWHNLIVCCKQVLWFKQFLLFVQCLLQFGSFCNLCPLFVVDVEVVFMGLGAICMGLDCVPAVVCILCVTDATFCTLCWFFLTLLVLTGGGFVLVTCAIGVVVGVLGALTLADTGTIFAITVPLILSKLNLRNTVVSSRSIDLSLFYYM